MTSIHIASTDRHLTRLLELEVTRMGFSCRVSVKPTGDASVILADADTGRDISLPRAVPVIVFSRRGTDEIAPALVKRAVCIFTVPFDLLEFRQALTRILIDRAAPEGLPKKPRRRGKLQLLLDPTALTVSVNGGESIKLSPTEYRILQLLNENRGCPVDARQAADILNPGESNSFNVYICYLRRKLEKGNLRIIRTVRGKGYCIDT